MKDSTLEVQLQSKNTELSTVIAAKDSELQEKNKQLKEISECFHRKENEVSEMTARLAEISKIKFQLDEANAHVDALGKICCFIDTAALTKVVPQKRLLSVCDNVERYYWYWWLKVS